MKAIYFLQDTEGVKYYKMDTFWSKSRDFTHAKVHSDSEEDKIRFFNSLLSTFIKWNNLPYTDEEFDRLQKWNGSIYGFQRVLVEKSDGYSLLEDTVLSEPIYLKVIDRFVKDGFLEISDARIFMREKLLSNLLDEKN